jgi:hypothetical protein
MRQCEHGLDRLDPDVDVLRFVVVCCGKRIAGVTVTVAVIACWGAFDIEAVSALIMYKLGVAVIAKAARVIYVIVVDAAIAIDSIAVVMVSGVVVAAEVVIGIVG